MNKTITTNDLLIFSCRSGNLELISERLKSGGDINYKNSDGETPVFASIKLGDIKVLEYLISHGASLGCVDNYGHTPLDYAIELNKLELAEYILNMGGYLGSKSSPYAKDWVIDFKRKPKLKR